MTWIAESYGKINLGLHVLERLPTGYHRIETGLGFIEWSDRFEVEPADRFTLKLSDPGIPAGDENLIAKAYGAFETYIGLERHYSFSITKSVPAGAGLGGGSSNAALTMRILNKLEDTALSTDELIDLSRDLGSDIAFFLKGETGIAAGMGHEIEPLPIQPECWIVTVFPGFESLTADAYGRSSPNPEPEIPLKTVLTEEPLEEWRYLLQNDLEAPVIAQHGQIGAIRDQLYEFGAGYASMTGSGSAVYGLFDQDFVAVQAYESFRELGFRVNLTRPGFRPDHGIYRKD